MAHSFHIPSSKRHLKWNNALQPVLTVPAGSEISFDLLDGGHNQVRPDNEATALRDFDFALADPAFGPVYIQDAQPGDLLKVEVLSLVPGDYGWTSIFPGFGLLAEDFPATADEQYLKIWKLRDQDLQPAIAGSGGPSRAVFKPGISVPVRPFLGVMGIAPASEGEFATIPPCKLTTSFANTACSLTAFRRRAHRWQCRHQVLGHRDYDILSRAGTRGTVQLWRRARCPG